MMRRNSDMELYLSGAPRAMPTDTMGDSMSDEDIEMTTPAPDPRLMLPARIAARFYKNKIRVSAASSRRNSISSLHSHHSTISGDSEPQQYQRRASIIETRRARLADRAAHVEKVRLRAALAKNSTRAAVHAERAETVRVAREKFLAEITAKCEEEVRRAKKRAEDTRERKAAEHARHRMEMAEKFAEAEKRRLNYRSSRRKTIIAEGRKAAPCMSEDDAARVVQKAWRRRQVRATVRAFRSFKLDIESLRNQTFDAISVLLSRHDLLQIAMRMLRLCNLLDAEHGSTAERGAVRTFLSSYLIVAHPTQVLSDNGHGEQEQDLISKARDLVTVFEAVLEHVRNVGEPLVSFSPDFYTLSESYNTFFSAFHAWKTHDSSVLVEIMLAQFVELELIWQTVKDDRTGGVADDYHQGIRQNQIMLLARLKRLTGADKTMSMVRRGVRKARRERRSNSADRSSGTGPQVIPRAAGVTPDTATDNVPSPLNETSSAADAVLAAAEAEMTPQARFTRALTALPDNRVLVHELLLNREYKVEQGPYTSVRRQIMEHMCGMMRRDVEKGLGTTWTVAMASVIQERLLRSLRPGSAVHALVRDVLDPGFVESQCRAGAFSYDNFFEFMGSILPQLCAPFRDPEVKAFAEDESGDAIDRLGRLMGVIDLLSLDHTNFMLHIAAPQLIQEAPGYEQRAFSRDLANGTVTLERTRAFWHANRAAVRAEMRRRDPDATDVYPPPAKIYAHGLVNLVLSNGPLHREHIPETLALDAALLARLRSTVFKVAATASILLSAKNLLKRDVRSAWKDDAQRILALGFCSGEVRAERVLGLLESSHPMPAGTATQLLCMIRRVLSPATAAAVAGAEVGELGGPSAVSVIGDVLILADGNTVGPSQTASAAAAANDNSHFTDPVTKLMLSRLRGHVLARLTASSASERVRATATASASLAGAGMPEFVGEVGGVVAMLARVREVDWLCHEHVYEQVWGEVGGTD